jgi:hypothetical protein
MRIKVHLLGYAVLATSIFTVSAFSLRGPTQWPGVTTTVDVDEEYRWNVPVVTYAFDQSFIDYFGPDGIKAVRKAFDILNALPRASRIDIDSYPLHTRGFNTDASEQNLYDMKSMALSTIIQQLGLDSPTEHVFDEESLGYEPILFHNFDPATLEPSFYVNGTLYTNYLYDFETRVDPLSFGWNAVADCLLSAGDYYSGLTRDDVGGLRYLLSRSNINREPAPSIISSKNRVTRRGGVEKILFVPLRSSRNPFGMMKPDILFSAGDNNWNAIEVTGPNWINCAGQNGNPGGDGPGVIRGPVRITFQKFGVRVATSDTYSYVSQLGWGSFDDANLTPLGAWQPNQIRTANVREFYSGSGYGSGPKLEEVQVPYGAAVALQVSSNNVDWTTVATVINKGGAIVWNHQSDQGPAPNNFMRAVRGDASNSSEGSVSMSTWDWSGELVPVGR